MDLEIFLCTLYVVSFARLCNQRKEGRRKNYDIPYKLIYSRYKERDLNQVSIQELGTIPHCIVDAELLLAGNGR